MECVGARVGEASTFGLQPTYRGNLPIRNREFLIWAKGKGGVSPSIAAVFKKHCGFIKDFSRELPKANYILCKNRLFLRNPRKAKCLGRVSYRQIPPVWEVQAGSAQKGISVDPS